MKGPPVTDGTLLRGYACQLQRTLFNRYLSVYYLSHQVFVKKLISLGWAPIPNVQYSLFVYLPNDPSQVKCKQQREKHQYLPNPEQNPFRLSRLPLEPNSQYQ